jgi:hypothetical protein
MTVGLLALSAALILSATATSSTERASGTLRVEAELVAAWKFSDDYCPPGKPVNIACVRFVGKGPIPGLGMATTTYVKTLESNGCAVTQFNDAVITIKGKGTLTLTRPGKACGQTAPSKVGPLKYTVASGTEAYERATGSLMFRSSVDAANFSCGPCGKASDAWSGTLTVPDLEFELTPPKIAGAKPMTVTAPKQAKGARVQYALTATDAIDGNVRVICRPPSGSLFKRGQTTVTCSATDADGNTAMTEFVVTVK